VKYPDPDYYYEDDLTAYCPYIEDQSFERCLEEKGVAETDKDHEDFEKCKKNFTKRHDTCRTSMQWAEYLQRRHTNKTRPIKCDKYNSVYALNLNESNFRKPYNKCERPFLVQRIANSNLILLVTKSDCDKNVVDADINYNPTVVKKDYEEPMFCKKLREPLFRRHSKSCMTHHKNVSMVTLLITVIDLPCLGTPTRRQPNALRPWKPHGCEDETSPDTASNLNDAQIFIEMKSSLTLAH
jgi:hypothetical protein